MDTPAEHKYYVSADKLREVLDKGVEVRGWFDGDKHPLFGTRGSNFESHSALLINLKPLAKPEPVSKEEVIKALKEMSHKRDKETSDLIERINKVGLK